jgi:hypothetical protein
MAFDLKYGQVQLERGTIGPDEPVVVFRAQDVFLPQVLQHYRELCLGAGSPEHHLDLIVKAVEVVREWQNDSQNHVQVPQSQDLAPKTD